MPDPKPARGDDCVFMDDENGVEILDIKVFRRPLVDLSCILEIIQRVYDTWFEPGYLTNTF